MKLETRSAVKRRLPVNSRVIAAGRGTGVVVGYRTHREPYAWIAVRVDFGNGREEYVHCAHCASVSGATNG